ncbi:Nn.00g084900.m01.CDS01 [Neocucurbitaria sp. VM-36]
MFTTSYLTRSLTRAFEESTRFSRRTVLEYTNRESKREFLHTKMSEKRNLHRQEAAFARRHIQGSFDEEMPQPTTPTRRSAPSPRYGSGCKSAWKLAELQRNEARSGVIKLLIQKDYLRLCSMSGQINTTLTTMKAAQNDCDMFDQSRMQLIGQLKAAAPHITRITKCDIPSLQKPTILELPWQWATFKEIHTYLYEGAERGDLSEDWYTLLDNLEEFAEVVELPWQQTYHSERTSSITNQASATAAEEDDPSGGGALDVPSDSNKDTQSATQKADDAMGESEDSTSGTQSFASSLNQSTSTNTLSLNTSAATSISANSQAAVHVLSAGSQERAIPQTGTSASGVAMPATMGANASNVAASGGAIVDAFAYITNRLAAFTLSNSGTHAPGFTGSGAKSVLCKRAGRGLYTQTFRKHSRGTRRKDRLL